MKSLQELSKKDAQKYATLASYANKTGKIVAEENGKIVLVNIPEQTEEEKINSARIKRNLLLLETDKYISVPDYPISAEQKAYYLAYRQHLRDIPQQKDFPNNIQWEI